MPQTPIPPQLKIITAFIRRAEELDNEKQDPDAKVVAYYCRTYAVDKGIKLRIDDPAVNNFLFGVMDNLELAKKSLDENKDSGAITCENYAYNIFSKADEEYRSGNSTKDTARKFYAASSYYDILEQFGPLDDEVLEKRKYAKWKAADILRAIQAGQRPTLPESESDNASDPLSSIPAAPTAPPTPAMPVAPMVQQSAPRPAVHLPTIAPQHAPQHAPPPYQMPQSAPMPQQQSQPQPQQQQYTQPPPQLPRPVVMNQGLTVDGKVKDAIELAAFAISALKHNDIALAKQRLLDALRSLE